MRAVFESLFDAGYLVVILTLGASMIQLGRERKNPFTRLFGVMAIVLGAGDAFHLVPRIACQLAGAAVMERSFAVLGFGKLVTSITMTVFYVLLYHIWEERYRPPYVFRYRPWIYGLALLRIVLCLLPWNGWFSPDPPLAWGIIRNVPFLAMGVIVCSLFFQQSRSREDQAFRWMGLAIALSFAFYIPVVLWAEMVPAIGMLMIPKTLMYVWMVWMGYAEAKRAGRKRRLLR